ncbi:hypothetical protein DM01DRAFT_1379746 [Hesseltinella vesiculosa]|uniref:RING-CH-type domain-containing protein n=1 Tax=Hesseltinella vesiculosa TaxID=101127 RepID=A0A1X2GUZ3_9FUNG|nr:hypothetical protein DM01DRAFT_1379746 [Hesseltinella vesiculosa]
MASTHRYQEPPLRRQDAFHQDLLTHQAPKEDVKKCTICLNTREEDSQYITPCCCRGSVRYVHEHCLKAWIMKSPQCNMCLEYYSLPTESQEQKDRWQGYRVDYHLISTGVVLFLVVLCMILFGQAVRCSEPRKIPVSKFQVNKRPGAPDYIWVPVFKKTCWQSSMHSLWSMTQYFMLACVLVGMWYFHRRGRRIST